MRRSSPSPSRRVSGRAAEERSVTRERPVQAVILAGGRGSRLRPLTDTMPKPMVPFHGKPFLGYMVDQLREQGFERILLLLGYLPDVIIDHFGDGSDYGVEIEYDVTGVEDLTAHRVRHAADRIDDTFLLLYCDHYWPMRFADLWKSFVASGAPAQITVYSNEDGVGRDSVIVGADGFVEVFDRERTTPGLAGVEISYALLEKSAVLPLLPPHQELFEVAVYPVLTARRQLHAFVTPHRYYSVGSVDRLPVTEEFLAPAGSRSRNHDPRESSAGGADSSPPGGAEAGGPEPSTQ